MSEMTRSQRAGRCLDRHDDAVLIVLIVVQVVIRAAAIFGLMLLLFRAGSDGDTAMAVTYGVLLLGLLMLERRTK